MYNALKLNISHERFGKNRKSCSSLRLTNPQTIRPGLLEKAYEVCLQFELKNCGQGIKRFVN